jgi:hypothetical protein
MSYSTHITDWEIQSNWRKESSLWLGNPWIEPTNLWMRRFLNYHIRTSIQHKQKEGNSADGHILLTCNRDSSLSTKKY